MLNGKISHLTQAVSLRRYTLTEGEGKGLDVIDCCNGQLRFLVNVTKACDIMQVYHKGENVSFISKNGFSAREVPFSKRFEGGMLYTCGLDNVGGREGFEVHGGFHNTPAEVISAVCDEQGISIEARVACTELFGCNFVMKRKIACALNSESIVIEDTLYNAGYVAENYCLLYHVNIGYPLLDEGGRIVADVGACEPRTPWAAANAGKAFCIEDPTPGAEETCYYLTLNKPEITYLNAKTGKSLTLRYAGKSLTRFLEWKSMACGDYALGLEPCTTALDDGFEYQVLGPQETETFRLELTITQNG